MLKKQCSGINCSGSADGDPPGISYRVSLLVVRFLAYLLVLVAATTHGLYVTNQSVSFF